MLEFLKISHPQQINEILNSYEPLQHTWIVSDLKSKQEIQNLAIAKFGYFTDDSILRVSDFWRLWLRRLEPTLNVVSSDFIKTLVQNFVDENGEQLEIIESEISTLNKALQEFAPLLLHPASAEVIEEWLAVELNKSNQEKKWHRWYQLSKICLNYILQKRNAIDSRWTSAYLQSLDFDLIQWPRPLFVDLGSELSSVEMGLFKALSQKQNIKIISPAPEWAIKFPNLLNVYNENFGYGKVEDYNQPILTNTCVSTFVRVSTQLAEVKTAVAKVRNWLNQNIQMEDIALVAADIEKFWPVLQQYLDEEGIPYRKDTVAQLNSLGDVQNFIAALKNYSQDVSWDSLERSFFSKSENPDIQFEKFKALFYQLYDEDDLKREEKIKELYFKKIDFSAEFERDEFLSFVVKIWVSLPDSNNRTNIFEIIFKDFLSQSLNVKLKLSRWMSFLKNRISHKEITIKRSNQVGIQVLSVMSAHLAPAQYRIYLGLNDEFFYNKQNKIMNAQDANYLRTQFDLAIDNSEESFLDFNLRWQSQLNLRQVYYTSAHLNFNSDPLNASLFFLENCPQSDVVGPDLIRSDELQRFYALQSAQIPQSDNYSNKRITQDLNGYSEQVPNERFNILSVTDLENYAKCSFKLLAAKGFSLRDYSQVSLDLDPRDRGTIIHSMFEFIILQITNGEFNIKGVEEFLNNERNTKNLFKNMDNVWNIQRAKFIQLAQRFVEFERQRLKIFSAEVEKELKVYFDLDKGEFSSQPSETSFCFRLRIDRIDTHKKENYSIVYDYKSSGAKLETSKKWITRYQFQMLLYLAALKEQQLATDVKGALYYFYKSFELNLGLIDRDIGMRDFNIHSKNFSLASSNEISELETQFKDLIKIILSRLQLGEFTTQPRDLNFCNECDWRKLCRAPHLL